ncbi:MAG TPA: hypothetical protein VHM19_12480 [Polyangiales bacterium]|jgi:general secretion pathway protein K|nr:hypothetical protein [Polyangiales bacterium]
MTRRRRKQPSKREQGVALVMVLTIIAVITVFVAELTQNTTTAFQVAISERDRLRAEYIAKSGLNLTRLVIAKEPQIRAIVAPMYQMVLQRPPPQMNVWTFADTILAPFANYGAAKESGAESGIDFSQMKGLKDTGGTFEIVAMPENTRLNVNNPLYLNGTEAQRSLAMQLFALTGGFQQQSPYDAMFNGIDPDGQITTRLDVVSDVIDWWDWDQQKTDFNAGAQSVSSGGGEDDIYSRFQDPYLVKNSAFDSLEELRMIRGVTDDFWATFVQSDPDDPRTRHLTVYGSGAINPNEAPPEVLVARVCSFVPEQPLCNDPLQMAAFTELLRTARQFMPIPWFTTPNDFMNFVQGKGGSHDLYPMLSGLQAMMPAIKPLLLWTPIVVPQDKLDQLKGSFVTGARIFTIQSTGTVGHASVRLSSVVNFDDHWTPPPPSAGHMGSLGVFHHFRVD